MSLAVVHSRALAGLEAPPVAVEVHLAGGLAGVQPGRPARHRGQGIARTRARGAAERAVRVSRAQDHRQSRAGRPAQGIGPLRSADRDRHPRGDGPDSRERARVVRIRGRARARRRAARDPRRAADGAGRAPRRPRVRAAGGERRRSGARARCASCIRPRRCWRCARISPGASRFPRLAGERRAPTDRRSPISPTCADRRKRSARSTIAAAGGHSLLMIGPPGTGKSMLAQRLPGLLPPLTEDEALASAAIASLAGRFSSAELGRAPVSRAASHRERGRADRRRQRSAPRRDLARAPRRAVSRRAAGMGPPRAGGAARAARVRRHPHLARGAAEHVPGRSSSSSPR